MKLASVDGLPQAPSEVSDSVTVIIGRLKAIIEGARAPEPEPVLYTAELWALDAQRAERARRAGAPCPPDEPWDILEPADRAADGDPPWRGAG